MNFIIKNSLYKFVSVYFWYLFLFFRVKITKLYEDSKVKYPIFLTEFVHFYQQFFNYVCMYDHTNVAMYILKCITRKLYLNKRTTYLITNHYTYLYIFLFFNKIVTVQNYRHLIWIISSRRCYTETFFFIYFFFW